MRLVSETFCTFAPIKYLVYEQEVSIESSFFIKGSSDGSGGFAVGIVWLDGTR